METRVAGFDWDEANRDKCQKHGVSVAAIESLFRWPLAIFPDPAHSRGETRFKAIGRTEAGRYVLLVFTLRSRADGTFIRPISARYMHAKEVNYYETEAAEVEKR
ncbi:MAG: BrnT family toxin [Proteobacteria bacterium]|nr:BrnT family toxin [Pseudomonadota bacterium]